MQLDPFLLSDLVVCIHQSPQLIAARGLQSQWEIRDPFKRRLVDAHHIHFPALKKALLEIRLPLGLGVAFMAVNIQRSGDGLVIPDIGIVVQITCVQLPLL